MYILKNYLLSSLLRCFILSAPIVQGIKQMCKKAKWANENGSDGKVRKWVYKKIQGKQS